MNVRNRVCTGVLKFFLRLTPHVITLLLTIGYLCLGGYLFCVIEGWAPVRNYTSNNTRTKTDFEKDRDHLEIELFSGVDSALQHNKTATLDAFLKKHYNKKDHNDGWTLLDGFLYSYSALTTIGYSHLATNTAIGRIFYVFYGVIGIPIFTLVVADWGLLLEEGLSYICRLILKLLATKFSICRAWSQRKPLFVPAESLIFLPFVVIIFLLYVALGGFLLPLWETDWSFVEGFYVAFDGITTIGIGDIYPRNNDYFVATLLYMSVGIAIASTAIGGIGDYLRVLHYAGTTPSDCGVQVVWFGGKHMKVNKLVQVLGRDLGATDYEIRALQIRLDRVINRAFDNRGAGHIRRGESSQRSGRRSMLGSAGSGGERERWHDEVIVPLTLVPVQNATPVLAGGYAKDKPDFYGSSRQNDSTDSLHDGRN